MNLGFFFGNLYIHDKDSNTAEESSYFPLLTHFSLPIKAKSWRNSVSLIYA